MPLNYSKWDQLELSDDSDIEGHPNVDKKSLIRLKQRTIHEKREARKAMIASMEAEIAMNNVLLPRLENIAKDVGLGGSVHFSNLVERLKTQPSPEAPQTNAKDQPTYDEMVLSLLLQVWEEVKTKGINKSDPQLDASLAGELKEHAKRLGERQEKVKVDLEVELKEQSKKITSEDIHDGFDSKYVPPPKPTEPVPLPKKKKVKETMFETINPKTSQGMPPTENIVPADATSSVGKSPAEDEDNDGDDELPELTPALLGFSKIKYKDYNASWKYIQDYPRHVIVPGATDALLVEAFSAQRRGQKKYAKQCVHQGLLLQYCEKLGPDGVRLFFRRMVANEKQAQTIFLNDVEGTYKHIVDRVAATAAEEAGRETIQLMQEDASKPITFNVPDGPPPEDLRLEGPGTEDMDIEEVRKALRLRWEVFESFSDPMKEALKTGSLDEVNKVLGEMTVEDAEEVVRLLQIGGIMNFSDNGNVRDMTKEDGR
ncbi:hypothetical protein Clacol_009853 [Clathrus columnatus]|uniref:Hsp90 chaperone protein kinase-targeting subunit n=1 Tax=Clathrus columnatus TaxID=1419009 RepID=A0AAV5AS57_9AGAM|nr:hypothetical protein Clacol_009853 [Clathrus columnatus]